MASAGVRTNGYVILPPCPQKCPASPNSALSCFGAISGGIRDGCSRALIRVCSRLPDADSTQNRSVTRQSLAIYQKTEVLSALSEAGETRT
ncbi:hypothetical protein CLOM_g13896 [Closterium sp. NIES-68]|nr:hypothetical protein CLOM_g18194 [Closterium sp. NIES-68]GJP54878.1 hypothetical protein CLOM_g13896 [Closterium sp. NIES-68]